MNHSALYRRPTLRTTPVGCNAEAVSAGLGAPSRYAHGRFDILPGGVMPEGQGWHVPKPRNPSPDLGKAIRMKPGRAKKEAGTQKTVTDHLPDRPPACCVSWVTAVGRTFWSVQ